MVKLLVNSKVTIDEGARDQRSKFCAVLDRDDFILVDAMVRSKNADKADAANRELQSGILNAGFTDNTISIKRVRTGMPE
jgi:hypothetical protein